ncbi:MAG: GNAT family N-acetyltransferase, partial [Clostridiales bacterium]|nr:GNAT family N-acetyltransferase [Clostridium sp.]MDD7755829.1 GNAT family N-acetyltransferase [Clostridiales bacterium]
MNFSLVTLTDEDLNQYKADMQEAFQKGFEDVFGKTEDIILPEKDIDNSLNEKGSVAYKAVVDGEMVGGAVVVIDEKTQHNHLDFLYVKYGT